MKTSKVVFVNRFFYPDHSATSQMLTDLAFDLAESGEAVEIVTSRLRYDDSAAQLSAYESISSVHVHRVWTSRFGRGNLAGRAVDYFTFYLSAACKLWQLTDANTVVVAKTDPPLISIVAAFVVRLRRARLVNWLQDLFPEVATVLGLKFMGQVVQWALRWARNLSLKAAHTNVVLGRLMEVLVVSEGISQGKVQIIHNWADGTAIKPVTRDDNVLRAAWGLKSKFVVGYSGNLGRAHEFNTILDSAELLKGRPDIVYLFIGGGAQRDVVEFEARLRGLGNVQFQPYQDRSRLSDSLSVADVHMVSLQPALEGLIVPSKYYGIAAAGRPTIFIGKADGEIARIVTAGNCGIVVTQGEGEQLAEAVVNLADDLPHCQSLGGNARSDFDEKYGRGKAVSAWRKVLAAAV